MLRRNLLKSMLIAPIAPIILISSDKTGEVEYNVKDRMSMEICDNYIKKTHVTKTGTIIRKEVYTDFTPSTGKVKTSFQCLIGFDTELIVIGFTGKPYVKVDQWFLIEA